MKELEKIFEYIFKIFVVILICLSLITAMDIADGLLGFVHREVIHARNTF